MFLVFEGIDGSGKTTQLQLFKEFIEQRLKTHVLQVRDPGTTAAGLGIRKILLDKTVEMDPMVQTLLFTAARAALFKQMEEAYHSGTVILCDRWVYSTYVYQSEMGNLTPEIIGDLHRQFVRAEPDAYVLIDCPAEAAEQRKRAVHQAAAMTDRFESKPLAWRIELRDAYLKLAATRSLHGAPIIVIDGGPPHTPEMVANYVLSGLIENCPAFTQLVARSMLGSIPPG